MDGVEFGGVGFGFGESAGDGLDGGEFVAGEKGVEDVAANSAGAAEYGCCGHVWVVRS